MKNIEELSKSELLDLIYHELPSTFFVDHPCQCALCGTCNDIYVEHHGRKTLVYSYICDRCTELNSE
jgi:hypothetical protein